MTDEELKPLNFGEVIDRTYRLGFTSIRAFLPVYLFNFLLLSAVSALSSYIFSQLTDFSFIDIFSGHTISNGELVGNFQALLLYYGVTIAVSLIAIYSAALIISLTIKIYLKKEVNLRQEAGRIALKYPLILTTAIIATFISSFGILGCGIGVLATSIFMIFYMPALLHEEVGVFAAISRSARLVSYSFWQLLGVFLLAGLLISPLSIMVELLINPFILKISNISGGYKELMVGLLNGSETFREFTVLLAAGTAILMTKLAVSIIVTAMSSSFHIVLFFNQKVRFENYGVERMAEVFAEGTETTVNDDNNEGSDGEPPQYYS